MEMALQGLQLITDDIIVFDKNFDEHMCRVEEVLEKIKAADLKLKPEKCLMLQKKVHILDHVVHDEGMKPSPSNIFKIMS